jgi:dTDP-4-dehydrorhamnose 3,5-epimerase
VIITPTDLPGPAIIDLDLRRDDRGFFARTFCREEFLAAGLDPAVEQCNMSFNDAAGTLRGMHWQAAPHPEPKLVRCTRGAIFDIIVDVRDGSPHRLQHVAVELSADNRRALYVPANFAHGYVTLTDDAEVVYQTGGAYAPGHECGLRYDDPALGLPWPVPVTAISAKDASWPLVGQSAPVSAVGATP